MKKIIILSVILTSLFIAKAFAQASIKAEVDKTIVTSDDIITYKLIVTSSEKNIPKPQPEETQPETEEQPQITL